MQVSAIVCHIFATNFDTSSPFHLLTMHFSSRQTTKMHPKIIHITSNKLKQPDFEVCKNDTFTPRLEKHH